MEVIYHPSILNSLEMSMEALDTDTMCIYTLSYAFRRSVSLPETYTGNIIRIYTDDVHPGYVRLIWEKENTPLILSDLHELQPWEKMHGPAVLRDIKKSTVKYHSFHCEDKDMRADYDKFCITLHDTVYAVHSPYWPEEAAEWLTRRRSQGFPSKSVIKRVVRYGCDFVQVSHDRCSNDDEWRFSFSKAELFIIKSWTKSQKIVYATLWVLNKKLARRNVCTYYFKTLMFWACEEKPIQFWQDEFLIQSVRELLIEMMTWLKLKFCLNYFMPCNNMLDKLTDEDLSFEITVLWGFIAKFDTHITDILYVCLQTELYATNMIYNFESPGWIKRAFIIYYKLNNAYDNHTDLFCSDITTDLHDAVCTELFDINRGLYFQQKSANCVDVENKRLYFLKSKHHLLLAVDMGKSQERDIIDNCSLEFNRYFTVKFMEHRPEFCRSNVADVEILSKTLNTLIGSRHNLRDNVDKLFHCSVANERNFRCPDSKSFSDNNKPENTLGVQNLRVTMFCTSLFHNIEPVIRFYKVWPSRGPTVNISWFIAKAYLANLYYTTQRDINLAIKTCDDIVEVYEQSEMNKEFAEKAFPVVLSTQWTGIYDKEIQELLGFYSLCSYVFDPRISSVYLGICPVQFALYLKLRCNRDVILNSRSFNISGYQDYIEHFELCECDENVNNGFVLLPTACVTMRLR